MTRKSAPSRIRVLCVDDHPIIREGVAGKISLQPDMETVGAAASAEDGVKMCQALKPDVILMDLQFPGMSGLDAIRMIRQDDSRTRIVVLTMYHGDEDIFRALSAGADAYVLKTCVSDDLIRVVREVYEGRAQIGAEVAARLAIRTTQPVLTARELRVVELIATGLRNREIAKELTISEDTVEVHLRHIFTKLNVRDRTAAVAVALKRGMVHIP